MVGDGCHRGLTLNAARQLEIRMFASGIANCRDLMNVSVQFPDRHDLEVNPENPDSRQGSTNSFNSYHRNTRSNRSDRNFPAGSRSPPTQDQYPGLAIRLTRIAGRHHWARLLRLTSRLLEQLLIVIRHGVRWSRGRRYSPAIRVRGRFRCHGRAG